MKKTLLGGIAVALVVILMPGIGLAANVNVDGLAYMIWNSPAFEGSVNWIDPTGADTRSSFGGTAVNLNGVYEEDNGAIDGAPWATSGISKTLADGTGNVNGSGFNTPSLGVQEALSSISLSGNSFASVDIAQAVLRGQFTVAAPMTLDITADYLLQMSLLNTNALFSYVDVSLGFTLSDFDAGLELASDSRFFSLSLTGNGSDSFLSNFQDPNYVPLHLTYNLVPGVNYDFESQTSTAASAASVPEPMSLILLVSGIAGLAVFKKRFE